MFRAVVLPQEVRGALYFHSMPGRYEPLGASVAEIEEKGIDLVVSLTPLEEIHHKSPEYAKAIDNNSLRFERKVFGIVDFGVPKDQEAFLDFARNLADDLKSGRNILIHCGAGIGRTGTLAASVLISLGSNFDDALETIRKAGSEPETREQMDLVRWVAKSVS